MSWSMIVSFFSAVRYWMSLCSASVSICSNAIWQRKVLLLQIPHQRAAVDLASDPLLHHLPPVELKTRVHCLHPHCCKVHGRINGWYLRSKSWKMHLCHICNFNHNVIYKYILFTVSALQLCWSKSRAAQRTWNWRITTWYHSRQGETSVQH